MRVWSNTPLKLTAAGLSYAGGRNPYTAWQHHTRPQFSGDQFGRISL
jgi:hypothetical protein